MKFNVLLLLALFIFLKANAQIYPIIPPDIPASEMYQVWANGEELFTGEAGSPRNGIGMYAFTTFDFSGSVTIKVKFKNAIKWLDIMPSALGIESKEIDDYTFEFTLDKPEKLTVITNNNRKNTLHIITGHPEKDKPNPDDANVSYFKAGKTYDVGILDLKDNQTLYIEGGAKLRGMVRVRDAKNVKILGRGMIDGTINKQPEDKDREKDPFRLIYLENSENVEIDGITLFNSLRWTIHPFNCTGLTISNIRIFNWDFGSDGIDISSCQDVTITNSFLRTNDDCIAVKALSFKMKDAHYPNPKIKNGDVKNILVEKSVFWNMEYGNVFDIGFELRCDNISDIVFRDCDVLIQEGRGAVFSIHNGDYAKVENILWEDIRIENADGIRNHKLIDLAILFSIWSYDTYEFYGGPREFAYNDSWDNLLPVRPGTEKFHASHRGHIQNIRFKDIQVLDGKLPYSVLQGFDEEHMVKDIVFENITVSGKKINNAAELKLTTQHAKNISFE